MGDVRMKHLRETFTDQEWVELQKVKEETGCTWHDFILLLCNKGYCALCNRQVIWKEEEEIEHDD